MHRLLFLTLALLGTVATAFPADDQNTCAERQGEQSIAACTRVISSGQIEGNDLATIYALRGTTYRNSGDYEHAIADFTQTIELLQKSAPADVVASAYVTRASAYSLKDDLKSALADYRSALALDMRNEQAAEGIRRTEAALTASTPLPSATTPVAVGAPSGLLQTVPLAPNIEAPHEPLPAEVPIDPEILRLVETHPFFTNAPSVLVGEYSVENLSNYTFNGVSGTTKLNNKTSVRWLRQGLVEEETIDQSVTSSAAGNSRMTGRTSSVSVVNGLISLGYNRVGTSRFSGNNPITVMAKEKLLSIYNMHGRIFPVEIGNRFSYDAKYQSLSSGQPSDEKSQASSCEISKKYEAKAFHPKLSGAAYLLTCDLRIVYKINKAANINYQWKILFFETLGVWISTDPAFPRERIVQTNFDNNISAISTLKSFALAR